MRGTIFIFAAALTVLLAFSCGNGNADSNNEPESKQTDSISIDSNMVNSINDFSIACFKQTIESAKEENVFISPLSMSIALGMTWNGARGNTATEMRNVLGYGDLSPDTINESYRNLIESLPKIDPGVILEIANSIWIKQGYQILQSFLNINSEYFHASVRELDFSKNAAVDTINGWVAKSTHDKIKTIISAPIDPLVRMYLINAVYFKGTWTHKFDTASTQKAPFHITPEKDTTCDLMYQSGDFPYLENDDFQAVDLPYGNEDYSMAVLLPVEGQTPDSLLAKLNPESWNSWVKGFHEREVILYLPRFKLSYETIMNKVLIGMGMALAFDNHDADFKGMEPKGELFINRVIHKTFVQVDEKGTEAAAVTGVEMALKAAIQRPPQIRVDRPFLFVIHEKTSGTILFMGKIVNPVWED